VGGTETGRPAGDPRSSRRAVVLVDGEHHPDALRSALDALRAAGDEPCLAVYVGGSEKVEAAGTAPDLGVPTVWPDQLPHELPRLIAEVGPDVVVDRTGDPVVDDRIRNRLAATVLAAGIPFEAPGLRLDPPPRPHLTRLPVAAVVATGKRTGKTAVSGALARHAAGRGRVPVVVAMGRGGPPDPVVIPAGRDLSVEALTEAAATGTHAASDFYEDAVMTGVTTVGCRRVGEGPAGTVGHANVAEGLEVVERLDADLVVLEGSGAAIPPCHAGATALIVPADVDPYALHAMLPLRFLLADLLVVTMADERLVPADRLRATMEHLDRVTRDLPDAGGGRCPRLGVVTTRFRPVPLRDVAGARVFVATTAPERVGPVLAGDLAATGASVVGVTHALSDRVRLRQELAAAPPYDVLVTELKAAAVDVAAAEAQRRGTDVVFYDNRPEAVEAPGLPGVTRHDDVAAAFDALLARADDDAAGGDRSPAPVAPAERERSA
jgi:cyclic 2,3-diphosphoglycerate synthetase